MRAIRLMVGCFALILFPFTLVVAQQPDPNGTDQKITVPNLVKFSGTLKYPDGNPEVGSIEMKFSLYASQKGGSALWDETQMVQTDNEGNYSAPILPVPVTQLLDMPPASTPPQATITST